MKKRYKRSIKTVNHIGIIVSIIMTLVVANVLFTMATGEHLRSGENVMAYKSGDRVKEKDVIANRGHIYARNGKDSQEVIAQDIESYDLLAIIDQDRINAGETPAYVTDFTDTSAKLAPILNTDAATLEAYFNSANENKQTQTEFGSQGKGLSAEQKGQIEALGLYGLEFTKSTARKYTVDYFASQMVGYADYNYDDEKITGVMGLEKYLDKELSGKNGVMTYQTDANDRYLPNTKKYKSNPVDGNDVYLTIDKNVQLTLEKALKDTMETNSAEKAWAIVMEAKTGKVLAQAGYPSFSLNDRNKIDNYLNLPSEYPFEPGSVMKAFVYAAAMDSGVYDGAALFQSKSADIALDANGRAIRADGVSPTEKLTTISDALGKDYGVINYDEGLIRSANTAIVSLLSSYLDQDKNLEYLNNFKLFEPVQIKGVGEVSGNLNLDHALNKVMVGIGQSSTVNSYELVQAASAIFGDGSLIKPYVIDKIVNPNTGKVEYEGKTEILGQPISATAAKQLQGLLARVVSEKIGTANNYSMSNISMMAKTGTGQIAIGGKYSTDIYTSSILAAVPAEEPEIIIYYAFEGPNYLNFNRDYFKDIVVESLAAMNRYSESTPEPSEEAQDTQSYQEYTMPALVNHSLEFAEQKLDGFKVTTHKMGDGSSVVAQFPQANTNIISNQNIFLLTSGTNIALPNMSGWSRKDVQVFANLVGFEVTFSGSGGVASQSLPEGTIVNAESKLSVELK